MTESKEQQRINLKQMAELSEKENGKKCSKCDGTGIDSWNPEANSYIACVCIQKAVNSIKLKRFKEVPGEVFPEENN